MGICRARAYVRELEAARYEAGPKARRRSIPKISRSEIGDPALQLEEMSWGDLLN
jgi:hypothetical protein